MKTIRMLGLAAALACPGALHAQGCSGGPDGGADATGNQCNQLLDMADYGVSPRADAPQLVARPTVRQRSEPVLVDVRPVAARTAAATARATREQGLREYDAGHFAIAANHLSHAAELGDPRSAEMLALMYGYGERLYGNAFSADRALAGHWLSVAIALRHADHSVATASSR